MTQKQIRQKRKALLDKFWKLKAQISRLDKAMVKLMEKCKHENYTPSRTENIVCHDCGKLLV